MNKIAIFGGSFNPPHVGHLMTCQYILATRPDIDIINITPTYEHPFGKKLVDFYHRANMCDCMASYFDCNVVRTSRVEEALGGISYTINTLRFLKEKWGDTTSWALVAGSDLISNPDEWRDFSEIEKLAELIVIHRFGWKGGQGPAFMDISSTIIREKLRNGDSIDGWVPSTVLDYIKKFDLKFE